jgi:hypothetical protein
MRLVLIVLSALVSILISCNWKQKEYIRPPQLPYPSAEMAKYLQARVDSSEFVWFTDTKAAASAFCNEEIYTEKPVSVGDVVIIGEGIFHAAVEVHLKDKIILLTMERPYMEQGTKSIWQVIKMEEKKWPDSRPR